MTDKSLYERILESRGAEPASARAPRPSAAVVLWRRDGEGEIEVFWVQRAETLPFMGGWHAFPGGGLSRRDREVTVTGEPHGLDDPPAISGLPDSLTHEATPPDLVPGLVACALRELFEETGILLTAAALAEDRLPEGSAGARRRLLAKEARFAELVDELGVTLDASKLTFAGRWLTPPFAPLRFDNRFFLLEWPAGRSVQPEIVDGELVAGEWVRPGDAYQRWVDGEVLAAPPILHLLKVLAEDGPEAGLARLHDPREADLGSFRRIEFRPGVIMFPLATATLPPATHTNAYVLGFGECALIDPGTADAGELEALEEALDELEAREGRRVTAIWLTHHHPDHVGGVASLAGRRNLPVLAHPETARRLAGSGVPVDGALEDDQRVTLPGDPPMTVRVLHTPGHARGHLCFYDEARGSLLAGDMVAGVGTIVIDPPEGDMDDYLASLKRLATLEPATLLPAHGPVIKQAVAKLEAYVEHRLWREEKILGALRDGVTEAEAMLPRVYDDAPREAWPLARRQIEAHLARLRRHGRISGSAEDEKA